MLEKSKEYLWALVDLGLAVLIIMAVVGTGVLYKYQASLLPARTFTVSASGKATALPDIAAFSFSVVSEGQEPNKIASENNKKINAAVDAVKKNGVDGKDIKTSGYNLSPRYEYDEKIRSTFISGYTLTQTVSVKIRDFTKISKILSVLPGLGINQVGSLGFDAEESEKYLSEARKEAFEKAYAKAKEMAKQNGARIRLVTFSESSGYPYPIYAISKASFDMGGGEAVPAPNIEPGSQEVTVNVNVTYEIVK